MWSMLTGRSDAGKNPCFGGHGNEFLRIPPERNPPPSPSPARMDTHTHPHRHKHHSHLPPWDFTAEQQRCCSHAPRRHYSSVCVRAFIHFLYKTVATGQSNMLSCSGPVVVSCFLAVPSCRLVQPAFKTSPVTASCQSLGLCFLSWAPGCASVSCWLHGCRFVFTHRAHVPFSVHTLWAFVYACARALSCVFPHVVVETRVMNLFFCWCLCDFRPAGRWKWALVVKSDTFPWLCDHVYLYELSLIK